MLRSDHGLALPATTPSLTSVETTLGSRRAALIVAIIITAAAGFTLPVAHLAGPSSSAFLPTWAILAVAADTMTAYLFFGQFLGTRQPALAVLAGTYLYSSLIIVPYLLTFPHVFAASGLFGAGPQTAIWLWVFWHGGFPLGLLAYLWTEQHYGHVRLSARAAKIVSTLLCLIVPGTILVLTVGVLAASHLLPVLIVAGRYTTAFSALSPIGICTWGVGAAAGIGLVLHARKGTMAQLWLSLATLACVLDVVLTMTAGSRYSLGWYMARMNSLIEAGVVLCAMLYEINQL